MKDDVIAIFDGLLNKSKENKVAWVHASTVGRLSNDFETIEPSAEDYAVSTASYTINIFRYTNMTEEANRGRKGIRMNILNETGEVVTSEVVYENEREFPVWQQLMDLARKYVLGEDRLLKKIKEGLSKPGVFGSSDDDISF